MAFSLALHGLLIFGILRTVPVLFEISPALRLDVTLNRSIDGATPEQAYLKAEQAERGALSLEPERTLSELQTTGNNVLAASSNAHYIIPIGYQNPDLWQKYQDNKFKKRTVSAASHAAKDAAYLAAWRDKIEHIGTQQYQKALSEIASGGDLLMLVALDKAGNLLEIQIRRSSGNAQLDALAVSIVQAAAPFDPLPQAMQEDTEVLEIIRTWKFHAGS
jgi:TonB family protein